MSASRTMGSYDGGQGPIPDSEIVLEARGVGKAYPSPTGTLAVLIGVDLEVRRGTMVAVLGTSGSGKSTLLNILGTLDTPDTGTVTVRGQRVDRMDERSLAAFGGGWIGVAVMGSAFFRRLGGNCSQ